MVPVLIHQQLPYGTLYEVSHTYTYTYTYEVQLLLHLHL
jgi:hypothetical protein